MARIYDSLRELTGNTPLLRIHNFEKQAGITASILLKLEYFNPLGSIKDRLGLALIEDAESKGLIGPGSVIIEPTSGNTGIGLASVCAQKGYRLILTMPETMSVERRMLLAALGAEIVLTPGDQGMGGAVKRAAELARSTGDAYIPSQFTNPANPAVHERTTAREILADTDGDFDIFVACIGTGGTLTGVANVLKKEMPSVLTVGVEPASSPLLTKGVTGRHRIQGIGANFVPEVLSREVIDQIVDIADNDAFETARLLGKTEGLLVGISSGAAVAAAVELAKRKGNEHAKIVVIAPDTGERYLSSGLYQ